MKHFRIATFVAAAAVIGFAATAGTSSKEVCDGFVPPNSMKIPVGNHARLGARGLISTGITEAEYNKIMDRIEVLYKDVVKQKGANLVVNRLWTDSTVNASAEQVGGDWIINMYGGIARHPDTNYEGEALIACHEMGHHLGGAPKIDSFFGGSWASNEGASDYYATLKCLRMFFENEDNASIVARATIDPLVRTKCAAHFTSQKDQDICMRISLGAESVAYIFQDLSKEKTKPTFGTPDPSQVGETDDRHPHTQCRMDTYFQGAICSVAVSSPVSDSDYKAGSCVQGTDAEGWRPRCWFNPESSGGGGGGGGGGGESQCPLGDESLCKQLCQIDPSYPWCKNVTVVY